LRLKNLKYLTWGRFGFDGGKMGLISEPGEAWSHEINYAIKINAEDNFALAA
jgi:hypothetical protein